MIVADLLPSGVLIFAAVRLPCCNHERKQHLENTQAHNIQAAFAGLESMLIIVSLYGDGKHLVSEHLYIQFPPEAMTCELCSVLCLSLARGPVGAMPRHGG